jgi:hypothetical protein
MGVTDQKYRYRATPQVSASQVAEYLSATSTRRKRIIRDARFPKASITAQYDGARVGFVNFLDDDSRSFNHLAVAKSGLEKRKLRPDATDWLRRDSDGSMEALEAFQSAYNKLGFSKVLCQRVLGKQVPLDLWSTTKISVNLDLIVRRPVMNGADKIGGTIFLFSKGEPSTKARVERSKVIAGLILTYCANSPTIKGLGAADPSLCLAVDVFSHTAHKPPGTFATKLRNVEDAAEEIAARWKTIPPPDDYDGPDF